MNEKVRKENEKTGTVITLGVGLSVGSIATASIIAILANTISLWLAYLLLGLIIAFSIIIVIYWIYKKQFFQKTVGVSLKDISTLLDNLFSDIGKGNVSGIKIRVIEASVAWSAYKARTAFIGILVLLATSLFLMLNAYVMFSQIEVMERQTFILKEQQKLDKYLVTEKMLDKTTGVHSKKFLDIISSISNCDIIYNGNGGAHTYNKINEYLAFIEDLAIYEREEVISVDKINELVGFYLLAFYNNNNGEMKKYVAEVRKNYSDRFYVELINLMNKLKNLPENKSLLDNLNDICSIAKKQREKHE